mgnify:CR=1 FL=1
MPYSGTTPGLLEAVLIAVKAMYTDSTMLALLNAQLGRDSHTSYLIDTAFGGNLTSSMVMLGDLNPTQWKIETGALRLCIVQGDDSGSSAFQAEREFIDPSSTRGMRHDVRTGIYGYFHHDAFRQKNPTTQQEDKAIACARLMDWMRIVAHHWASDTDQNIALQLTSQEYSTGSTFDVLNNCKIEAGSRPIYQANFGGDNFYYTVALTHTGTIA